MSLAARFLLGIFLSLFAARFCVVRSFAQAPAPPVMRNIPYTTDSTGTYRADLYQPPTPGIHPAVVMIHGGSWRSGHKGDCAS